MLVRCYSLTLIDVTGHGYMHWPCERRQHTSSLQNVLMVILFMLLSLRSAVLVGVAVTPCVRSIATWL